MAKRSFFGFLKRAGLGSESICMSELVYQSGKTKTKIDDYSAIDIENSEYTSPSLKIETNKNPQIPIIGIGGCGVRVVSLINKRLGLYGLNTPILGIETNQAELEKHKDLSHTYLIPETNQGTAKQYRIGATLAQKGKEKLWAAVNDYLSSIERKYRHEIVFLVFGAGGTGVGVGIELSEMLINEGYRPVPILFFPGKEENTRIQFTAAAALYKLSYGPRNYCQNLCTILVDNEYFFEKNSSGNFSSILAAINERIGSTIADLIISSEIQSDGYSADLNEFLEIFRQIKGIGTLTFMHSGSDFDNVQEFFDKKHNISQSMELNIFTSTRSYIFIQANKGQVSAKNYRNLISEFNNSDIFPKFFEVDDDELNFDIRGLFTGVKISERIEELMQVSQDVRVEILNKEINKTKVAKPNPKIERLNSDEEIEVKTGKELAKERSEEFAMLQREGKIK